MKWVDVLRNRYVSSPHWVKRSISPLLSLVPQSVLYGNTYKETLRRIERSRHDPEFVRKYRSSNLSQLIKSCNIEDHFYHRIISESFGKIEDGREFNESDLKHFPILHKDEIRKNLERLRVERHSKLDLVSTSGSSGQPLRFYLDRDRSPKEIAFIHNTWARIGFSPGRHSRAVLRGVFLPDVDNRPWEYDSAMKELRLSPFHMVPEIMKEYLRLIEEYGINYLHGYPSALTMLASFAHHNNWKKPDSLKGILPISEMLMPLQRAAIEEGFGNVRILSFYGMSEKVAFAGEVTDYPGVYEFEPLYGIVELIDDQGKQIREKGRRGRIVATGLMNKGMPLFRYDTEDSAELVESGSSENCYRMRVREIRARRAQEYIVGYNGALISFSAINLHSKTYSEIQGFQLCQEKEGEVTIEVMPYPGQSAEQIKPFVDEIQAKVGKNVSFSLKLVEDLSTNPRGKRYFVDQKLHLPAAESADLS